MDAFRAFDFENNEKWQQYKSGLEIPAGTDLERLLSRFKAKWYKREIDPTFDVDALPAPPPHSSQPAQQRQPNSQPSGPPKNGAEDEKPKQSRTAPQSSNAPPPKGFLQRLLQTLASSPQERLFFLHAALLLFFLLRLQPLSGLWSDRAWGYFMQTALLTHGYKVYLKHGAPQLWPFKLAALKQWMMQASATTDFQYALLAFVFLPSKPIMLVMVPMATLAVYHFFAYSSQHFAGTSLWRRYGSSAHQWLVAKQQQALLYNAVAEIGAGFMVVISLLSPPRSFFLVFIYWQVLRMRYWSPDAANYHRMAWSQLDAKFGPYLNYLPILKTPVGYIQRWFQSAPGRQ